MLFSEDKDLSLMEKRLIGKWPIQEDRVPLGTYIWTCTIQVGLKIITHFMPVDSTEAKIIPGKNKPTGWGTSAAEEDDVIWLLAELVRPNRVIVLAGGVFVGIEESREVCGKHQATGIASGDTIDEMLTARGDDEMDLHRIRAAEFQLIRKERAVPRDAVDAYGRERPERRRIDENSLLAIDDVSDADTSLFLTLSSAPVEESTCHFDRLVEHLHI